MKSLGSSCISIVGLSEVSDCCLLQSIAMLEEEMLNGQKLQGPQTSAEIYKLLQKKNLVNE